MTSQKQDARLLEGEEPSVERSHQGSSRPLPDNTIRARLESSADRLLAFRCLDTWLSELMELSKRAELKADSGLSDERFAELLAEIDSFNRVLARFISDGGAE